MLCPYRLIMIAGQMFNVAQKLSELAQRYPDKDALVFPELHGRTLTYQTLNFSKLAMNVNRLANAFHSLGLAKGDRVVVMVPISIELYLVLIALLKMGVIAVFIDPWVGREQMARCCQLTEPKAFIGVFKAHLLRLFSPAIRQIPIQIVTRGPALLGETKLENLLRAGISEFETVSVSEEDPALITFTTGSTGIPKGAQRTHGFLMAQHEVLSAHLGFSPSDIDLPSLPVFVLNNLANGITSVFPLMNPLKPSETNPAWVVHQIKEFKVTTSAGSPAFFWPIAQYCLAHNIKLESIRAIFTGGAPVRPELIEALTEILPNGTAHVVYGSTEAEPISMINAQDILNETAQLIKEGQGNCVGKPVEEIDVRIIKISDAPINFTNWESLSQPAGPIGEIVVTGLHVNKTYYKNPEAVRENKFQDDQGRIWHRTGDTGYFDAKGRLWLMGRVKNRVIRAGQELHSLQIEPVVDQLDFVERSALIGVPDAKLGERAVLIVKAKEKNFFKRFPSERTWRKQIETLCQQKNFPMDEIHFCKKIPVDPRHNAKIEYSKLRQWYSA